MDIVVTGGTGYIGSALLKQLVAGGHAVTALVRSDEAAATVRKAGATPVVGDLFDAAWVAERFAPADAVVHTAATGDASTQRLDRAVVAGAVQALAGTGKPYVHTSGIWVYGDNDDITEDAPFAPPALTAWRQEVEQGVLDADLTATIVAPGIVYGHGGGIPAGVFGPGARDDAGRLRLVGDGTQHWTTVHVEDVAALYRIVLERGERLEYVVAASGDSPTVRELAEAAAGAAGVAGVAAETVEESRERLGALFADALLLDQRTTAAKAKGLGWTPTERPLVEELSATSRPGS